MKIEFIKDKEVKKPSLRTDQHQMEFNFDENEMIHTEISRKYNDDILKQKIRYDDELNFVFLARVKVSLFVS